MRNGEGSLCEDLILPSSFILLHFFSLPSHAVDQVEQQERHQGKEHDEQEGANIPKIRHVDIAIVCNRRNHREHLLISQAENHSARQETEQTGNNVIQFAFAATGGASARSVSGERHAHAEDQPADEIPDDISPRDIGDCE